MINLFSERHGIIKLMSLNPNEMPIGLHNRLWNAAQKYINGFSFSERNDFIQYLWDRFFKEEMGDLRHVRHSGHICIDQIKEKFYELEWYKVYDFLEFSLSVDDYERTNFINILNLIFIDERAEYKIIGDMVAPLISGAESEEVERAVESKYSMVSNHIKKAIELYRKRPFADYQNSIKESISAVEALARIILNKPNATLGDLVKDLNIHSAFKEAISKLYGWTSNEGGIRHSENGKELKIDEKEARYMLVQCSALVNYIISKNEK